MYAENDPDDQDIFIEALGEIQPTLRCVIAKDGEEAIELLREIDPPLCIYLDINMPNLNGLEVLRLIKRDERLVNIPTFILTTSKHPESEAKARSLGVTDYLIKPNSYNEFKKLLDTCFLAHVI